MTSRTVERAFPSIFCLGHRRGLRASGVVCPETDAPHGVKRDGFSQNLVPVLRKCCFMVGFYENLAKLPARTASSQTRSQVTSSKLRTPQPMRLCSLGSGEDTMGSSARRSWKRLSFSAIINCFEQKYDTSSTTNDDEDHCEKQKEGCQNSTICSVEYSREGSKTDDAEPSVIIWAPAAYYSENAGPLVHETSLVPRPLTWWHHSSQVDQGGQGALSPFCLTGAAILRI